MTDLPINTQRRQSYLPPVSVPTLAMIGKPILIISKSKTGAPSNALREDVDQTFCGILESFIHNRIYNILVFRLQGMDGKYQLNLNKEDVEVYDK